MPTSPAEDLGIPGVEDAVQVGSGGFATVYRARQPAFGRDVAVKVIDRRLDETALNRFRRECLAIGQLSGHPAIVTVFEAGQTGRGQPYLLMPFHQAGSLQDRLDRETRLPWSEACAVGIRMASALAEAHAAGILHRDVKPANILVDRFGEAVLTDFGIARIADGPETTSGTVTASLAHAAPEVLNGDRPTAAADIYSLGSTVHTLIAGSPPFHLDTDESVLPLMHRILTTDPPDLGPTVPVPVRAAIRAAMAKDPADRPPSATAFAELLRSASTPGAADVTAPAAPPSPSAADVTAPVTPPSPTAADVTAPVAPPSPTAADVTAPAAPPSPSAADVTVSVAPPPSTAPPGAPPAAPTARPRRGRAAAVGVAVAAALAGLVGAAVVLQPWAGSSAPDGPAVADLQFDLLPDGIAIDPEVRPLAEGAPAAVTLEPGQAVAFRFAGPETGWLALLAREQDDTLDPLITLFDAAGAQVGEDDDSGDGLQGKDAALVMAVDPSAGPFTAVVRGYDREGFGAFELSLDTADVVELPQDGDSGSFDGQPEAVPVMAYTFEGMSGDVVRVAMRSEEVDAHLQLIRVGESLVAEDDDGGGGVNGTDAALEVELDEDGTYAVLALQMDWRESGSWTLEVDPEGS